MKFVLFKNFINELFHSRFAADFTRNYNFNFLCELLAAVTKACNFATFINRQRHRDRVAIMRKRERWFRNGLRWCACAGAKHPNDAFDLGLFVILGAGTWIGGNVAW